MLCNQAENVKENYIKTDLLFPPDFKNADRHPVKIRRLFMDFTFIVIKILFQAEKKLCPIFIKIASNNEKDNPMRVTNTVTLCGFQFRT